MPFIQRIVEPVFLSRRNAPSEEENKSLTDYELETVANCTLSNALRQLASLVLIANDIFDSLTKELEDVRDRSSKLRERIEAVEGKVLEYDPKTVTVPESDLCSFAARAAPFAASHAPTTALFSADSRPSAVRRLYAAAAPTPVPVMRQLDRYRRDGARCSRYFSCTPVLLGGRRRRAAAAAAAVSSERRRSPSADTVDIGDIETSMPAVVSELRRWTSEEALGDITVAPDCSRLPAVAVAAAAATVPAAGAEEEPGTDHRLPSPEEQAAVVAAHFPCELVRVDVSGRAFRRMSLLRRSFAEAGGGAGAGGAAAAAGTATGRRRPRGRRRNTIAGTDRKELRRALAGESQDESEVREQLSAADDSVVGSSRSESQKIKDSSSSDGLRSHFNSLKQWGKGKLKLIKGNSTNENGSRIIIEPSEEVNIYETVTIKGKKADLKQEKKATASGSSIPISTQSGAMNMAVKLRQRQTRTGKDDAIHSSSGNWSASSESGRASIGSETTHQPKSTTTLSSAATSSNSLNHHHPSSSVCSRRKFLNTSTSSSVSEGTLTPDIVSDFVVPFVDDGETSSIYSCDTEGYYTSFHLDSGLKTLKEEETTSSPQTPLHSTSALSNSPGRGNNTLTAENEYELFGKGSTSTTTSSAGTVCTTLLVSNNESNLSLARGPTVPERKSSLDQKQNDATSNSQMVVAMVHKQRGCEMSESPDSGHNTSSSPVDSTSSPHGTLTGRSSEYEFSESDLEGVDRLERIRVKTTINSSRIPSMCVITPPPSDDETSLSQYVPSSKHRGSVPSSRNIKNQKSLLETDFGASIVCTQEKSISPQITSNEQQYQSGATVGKRRDCISPKQITSSDSVRNTVTSSALRPLRFSPKFGHSEVDKKDIKNYSQIESDRSEQQKASLLPPFNSMLGKMKEVLSSNGSRKESSNTVPSTLDKINKDAGDYVTISKTTRDKSPLHSPTGSKEVKAEISPSIDMEYVSLNELPVARSSTTANILISPSNSLERKRRQGARVTLDSEGKVIYSSDSLRRNKASHTTFEPGPYVKDSIASPTASPLMLHRVAKPNIRPVSLSNQAANTVSYSVSKPLSPVSENRQFSSHPRTTSPISPKLGKVIIRAGNRITSRITSPLSPVEPSYPTSPQASRGAYIRMKSPDEHQQRSFSPGQSASAISEMQDEGKSAHRAHPPQYIGPPPASQDTRKWGQNTMFGVKDQAGLHWNLPTNQYLNGVSIKKFPTQNTHSLYVNGSSNAYNVSESNYGQKMPQVSSNHGAYFTSQKVSTFRSNSVKENQTQKEEEQFLSYKHTRLPTPAMIPLVPHNHSPQFIKKHNTVAEHDLVLSSTPTKGDMKDNFMEMSNVLSPIQKCEFKKDNDTHKHESLKPQTCSEQVGENGTTRNKKVAASLQSKSSMTAEELFAAIHRSKKKLNIKGDFDNNYRSGSPSSSSLHSLSPGSSESSINGIKALSCSESSEVGIDNSIRNRHSWSPNAKQSLNFQLAYQQSVLSDDTKQSRASDRLGPVQPTSRNDFKRLLLQHGPKINGLGTYRGKMSAVEQLRLSRQQRHNLPTNCNMLNGGYLPVSPSDKRYNGPKLLPSPRSAASWRFASPRTDILSSTILEDCAEEEKASCSQEENNRHIKNLTLTTECSLRNTLSNGPVSVNFNKQLTDSSETTFKKEEFVTSSRLSQTTHGNKILSNLSPSTQVLGERSSVQNGTINTLVTNKSSVSSAPLSPSNVKENVDTNQQYSPRFSSLYKTNNSSLPESQLANLRARQMFMHHPCTLNSKESINTQPSASRIQLLGEKQKQNSYSSRSSPARSILAQIERKSPSRTTLETAL